jgi:hypothetical protein
MDRFPTVGKLNKYFGLHVVDGAAPKRVRGQKLGWNPDARKLAYKISVSFEKCGGRYRTFMRQWKASEREKYPEPIPLLDANGKRRMGRNGKPLPDAYSPGHIRMRALRRTSKLFLSHYWGVWQELHGETPRDPYPIERLGHTTFISPWAFVEGVVNEEEWEEPEELEKDVA